MLYTVKKDNVNNGKRSALAILDATNNPINWNSKRAKLGVWVDNAPDEIICEVFESPNKACCGLRNLLGRETTRGSRGVNVNTWLCTNADTETTNKLGHAEGTIQGLIQARVDAQVRGRCLDGRVRVGRVQV